MYDLICNYNKSYTNIFHFIHKIILNTMTLVKETAKKAEKAKNQLRIQYDYAQEHYGGLATAWKKDFISDADYQLFIRIYSYKPLEEIPQKFHTKIAILKNMISHHAELVRKYLTNENSSQLNIPMV